MNINEFFKHRLTITILTAIVTFLLTIKAHDYQFKQVNDYKENEQQKEEARVFLESFFELTDSRAVTLQRVCWVSKGTSDGNLSIEWAKYINIVNEWNSRLSSNKLRMIRLLGPDLASAFQNKDDSELTIHGATPKTLHGQFLRAHEDVRRLKECVAGDCSGEDRSKLVEQAQKSIDALGVFKDGYNEMCMKRLGFDPDVVSG